MTQIAGMIVLRVSPFCPFCPFSQQALLPVGLNYIQRFRHNLGRFRVFSRPNLQCADKSPLNDHRHFKPTRVSHGSRFTAESYSITALMKLEHEFLSQYP